ESFRIGQHRCKTMEFSIEPDALGHLAAIRFKTAVEIVKLHAGGLANRPVENLAWEGFAEGILPPLLPAGNEVIPLVEQLQKPVDLFRVVLQVAVHSDDDIAASSCESVTQPLGFAEVSAVA